MGVPAFLPFPGLRYSPRQVRDLDDVVCPPYDVISDDERAALLARSALNVVAIELPDSYDGARRLLDAWRDGGILVRDTAAAFYGYRMSFTDQTGAARSTVGVIGALGLEPPGRGILPHEETTPKAKTDRLELLRACRANVSPIWVLTPAPGLAAAASPPEHPLSRTVDGEGVVHECWPITDAARQREISELVSSAPVLVADGHHRYEVALAYQAENRGDSSRPGDHDAVMALAVELADDQLAVQPIHRLIAGLPEHFDLPAALAAHFELQPTAAVDATIASRMEAAASMAVVTRSGVWLAAARPATEESAAHDLDSSRLDVALQHLPDHQLTYQHGWSEAAAAVAADRAQAAVLLRPAAVAQIAQVGRGGSRMPAKTTFFWPKPRTGMVIRELVG